MKLLENIKAHLINNGIAAPIHFNRINEKNGANECIVLWQYDGTPNMVARNAKVQITVKNLNMKKAEEMADFI